MDPPAVISLAPDCIIKMDIHSIWQNLHIGFLTCRVRAMSWQGQVGIPENVPLSSTKIIKQK